jgi:hypothetical protein
LLPRKLSTAAHQRPWSSNLSSAHLFVTVHHTNSVRSRMSSCEVGPDQHAPPKKRGIESSILRQSRRLYGAGPSKTVRTLEQPATILAPYAGLARSFAGLTLQLLFASGGLLCNAKNASSSGVCRYLLKKQQRRRSVVDVHSSLLFFNGQLKRMGEVPPQSLITRGAGCLDW